MDIHTFHEHLDRNGIEYLDYIFEHLPEEDRTMIDFCAKQSEKGNANALQTLSKLYDYDDNQAARLYYGAHIGDTFACWRLGSYHLQGKYVFHADPVLARYFLARAKNSPWPHIAEAAGRDLLCLSGVSQKDCELRYYTLESYRGKDEVVAVPYMVKQIGPDAFKKNQHVKKVILPSSVTHIDARAFDGCRNLEEVVLPEGLLVIDWMAFADCTSLKRIELPASLQVIGEGAFWGCTQLEEITVYHNVSEIGKNAFYSSGLKKAVLGTGVRRIGKGAFQYTPLHEFHYPETLEEIDVNAFKGCKDLAFVNLYAEHYHWKRELTVRRGNEAFSHAAKVEYLVEQNRFIVRGNSETRVEMLLTENHLASREKESGYFAHYGDDSYNHLWSMA